MKYYIVLLLVLMTVSSQAQITPEHTYTTASYYMTIVQVDSAVSKYVLYNGIDSVLIYNLDHSLDRVIRLPLKRDDSSGYYLSQISRRLFDPDDSYECLIMTMRGQKYSLTIYRENGDILFGCVNCQLRTWYNYGSYAMNAATGFPPAIMNTENGAKMLVDYYNGNYVVQTTIFSLPGKVPGGAARLGVIESPSVVSGNSFPTSAYPNPSNGQMRISYKLPLGESTGELVIISTDGVEVKRYRVGEGFNDILIEKSDLPSGSYFYKLVTEKGESEVKRLVILK